VIRETRSEKTSQFRGEARRVWNFASGRTRDPSFTADLYSADAIGMVKARAGRDAFLPFIKTRGSYAACDIIAGDLVGSPGRLVGIVDGQVGAKPG